MWRSLNIHSQLTSSEGIIISALQLNQLPLNLQSSWHISFALWACVSLPPATTRKQRFETKDVDVSPKIGLCSMSPPIESERCHSKGKSDWCEHNRDKLHKIGLWLWHKGKRINFSSLLSSTKRENWSIKVSVAANRAHNDFVFIVCFQYFRLSIRKSWVPGGKALKYRTEPTQTVVAVNCAFAAFDFKWIMSESNYLVRYEVSFSLTRCRAIIKLLFLFLYLCGLVSLKHKVQPT